MEQNFCTVLFKDKNKQRKNIKNNTESATKKNLRQIMCYHWCFLHFAAAASDHMF